MNSIITFAENNSSIQNESLTNINMSNIKNSSNLINSTNEEIIKETNKIKTKIIELYNTNEVLKNELTNILEKLNLLSFQNKEQLIQINNKENNLQNTINNKKKDYFIIKNNNSKLKMEYESLLTKSKNIPENKISDILSNNKINILKLEKENKEIKKEIDKNEILKIQQQNKVMMINNDNLKLKSISVYNEKLHKYLQIKNNFINSINNSKKVISDNIQELNKLENMIQKKIKIISKNEKISNKINEEIKILKTDLSGTVEEIEQKCINNNILIFSLLNKNNNKLKNKSQKSTIIDDINVNNNSRISSNIFLVNSPSLNKNNNNKKNKKSYPIIHRNNSQSFITDKIPNNLNNFNYNLNQINDLISSENIMNKNEMNKNIFINRYTKLNNLYNKSFSNSDIIKLKDQLKFKNYNIFSMDLSNINYDEVDEEIYQKLQDKKRYILEENERMDFNIKEINKTFASKYNKVNNCLKNNIAKLNDIKIVNSNIQEEINQLQQLLKEIKNEKIKSDVGK